jgi:hypothetical protein
MTSIRIGTLRNSKVDEATVVRQLAALVNIQDGDDNVIDELVFYRIQMTQRIVDQFWKLLDSQKSLNTIKLMSCTGNVSGMITCIFYHETVATLVLSGNQDDQARRAIQMGLQTNKSVHTLKLLGVPFTTPEDTTIFQSLRETTSLRTLDMTRSHFAPEAASAFAGELSQNISLTRLNLDQCGLSDACLEQIISALGNNTIIQDLNLTQNSAHSLALTALAKLVASEGTQLKSLNLSHQILTGDQEELDLASLAHAVDALRTNTSITSLDISGNTFSDEAVKALAVCLSVNSTLETLDVSESEITETGMDYFAEHFCDFKGLKTFNLAGNAWNASIGKCFAQGLENNRRLVSLGPIASCPSSERIEHFLDLNVAGRCALQNDIPLGVWPQLLARANDIEFPHGDDEERCGRNVNALFSLLQGPALFER